MTPPRCSSWHTMIRPTGRLFKAHSGSEHAERADHFVVEVGESPEVVFGERLEDEADHRRALEQEVVAMDSFLTRGGILEAVEVEVARQPALVDQRRLRDQLDPFCDHE